MYDFQLKIIITMFFGQACRVEARDIFGRNPTRGTYTAQYHRLAFFFFFFFF